MPDRKASTIWEHVQTLVYAVLIAVAVRTFAYEPFSIPSGSMKPTLLIGDYLFVSKFSYGYSRYSLPFSPPLFSGRIFGSQPERGDVVVFRLPSDGKTDYIKRIIGLPGDRIQVIGGILHINGEAVKRTPIGDFVDRDAHGNVRRYHQYRETLPNGRSHDIIEVSDHQPVVDDTEEYNVPEGHYFAMGDNRDNSTDSRFGNNVGYVPYENLIGRADVIFFSVDGSALAFWEWYRTLRIDRIFQGIE